MSIANLSVQQLRQAADLKEKIVSLEKQLSTLLGQPTRTTPASAKPAKKGGISASGRARIAAAAKLRWAKAKAAKTKLAAKKKFAMSATAKAKLSALAKAR